MCVVVISRGGSWSLFVALSFCQVLVLLLLTASRAGFLLTGVAPVIVAEAIRLYKCECVCVKDRIPLSAKS